MMERIFSTQDNSGRGSEFVTEWRRRGRAAHPDALPSYFQFAVDADQPAVARSPRMAGVAGPRRSRQAENDPLQSFVSPRLQRPFLKSNGHSLATVRLSLVRRSRRSPVGVDMFVHCIRPAILRRQR
jgi:hypothetical protein